MYKKKALYASGMFDMMTVGGEDQNDWSAQPATPVLVVVNVILGSCLYCRFQQPSCSPCKNYKSNGIRGTLAKICIDNMHTTRPELTPDLFCMVVVGLREIVKDVSIPQDLHAEFTCH